MREIKFRAWQKYHKKMVEVTSISFDDTGEINGVTTFVENQAPQRINYKDGLLGGFFLKDERGMVLELMQSTGLKDENGVEIFEGDIVKVTDDDESTDFSDGGIGTVCGLEELYMWYIDGEVQNGLFDINQSYYIEVLGNIYENPELLEVAE